MVAQPVQPVQPEPPEGPEQDRLPEPLEQAQAPAGESAPLVPVAPSSGLPRWLLLLIGAATATIAVAGLKEIAWLAGPVLLALVVVIAVEPVQQYLLRSGWPRWASAA